MQKVLSIVFILLTTFIFGQFSINAHNTGWIQVNGSNGVVAKNAVVIQLHVNGPIDIKKWSLVGKAISPIVNDQKKEFPVNKFQLKFSGYKTQQYYAENYPTIAQLGIIQSNIPMNFSPVYLINTSPFNINIPTPKYGSIELFYDVVIEGGNYLNSLKSWNNYLTQMEFSLLNEFGNMIGTSPVSISMQISPNGNFDPVPEFSIMVDGAASNGELIFRTMQDYKNGVSKEYANGLMVTSDSPYEIQVSSLSPFLQSNLSDNLQLSSIKVQLRDNATNQLSNVIRLTNFNQTLISNPTKVNSKKYNIIYSTSPSDDKILSSKPGNYSTPLLYTIIPL